MKHVRLDILAERLDIKAYAPRFIAQAECLLQTDRLLREKCQGHFGDAGGFACGLGGGQAVTGGSHRADISAMRFHPGKS